MRNTLSFVLALVLSLPPRLSANESIITGRNHTSMPRPPMPFKNTAQIFRQFGSAKEAFEIMSALAPTSGVNQWINYFKDQKIDLAKISFAGVEISGNELNVPNISGAFLIWNDGKTIEHNGIKFAFNPQESPKSNVTRMLHVWGKMNNPVGRFNLFLPRALADDDSDVSALLLGASVGLIAGVVAAWNYAFYLSTAEAVYAKVAWSALGAAVAVGLIMALTVWISNARASGIDAEFKCTVKPTFLNRATQSDITSELMSNVNPEPRAMINTALTSACLRDKANLEKGINSIIKLASRNVSRTASSRANGEAAGHPTGPAAARTQN